MKRREFIAATVIAPAVGVAEANEALPSKTMLGPFDGSDLTVPRLRSIGNDLREHGVKGDYLIYVARDLKDWRPYAFVPRERYSAIKVCYHSEMFAFEVFRVAVDDKLPPQKWRVDAFLQVDPPGWLSQISDVQKIYG